ncbi:glycosyl hydrolase [Saccharicrinis aurantiacus]|uniref:glycosyl hydrolase n=1 Tax=Saccharicrinis aurantiacus TaxID=1849719 RepID=UPI0024938911|nr:glycosyl hydrolase [Saccharicrinis aurantiacus]
MKNILFNKITFLVLLSISVYSCKSSMEKNFKNPPGEFKPMPFWHINGELTTEGIRKQMKDAKDAGFSGVSLLPLAEKSPTRPGTSPKFLSDKYFERYQDMIDIAEELDMEIILYDDNDFPSGMAGGKMQEKYPDHTMKRLDKIEHVLKGPALFTDSIPGVQLMAAVAINQQTKEHIEISSFVKNGIIEWQVPSGNWSIMLFPLMKDSFHKKYLCMDFMDTVAVRHMINETYEKYKERFGQYFGNTIKTTFFDDVGFWRHPRNWTGRFNEKFEELNGFDPRPYYPALWYNIGSDTEAIRNAFFNTRAELLAEGFPKLVGQWNEANGLNSTGHPPGNYDPTPIDMNADIFKFYRYTQIPLTDAIIRYQFGQDGHKLISSAADYYDRPMVATEIYGAYKEHSFDSLMMYRAMMDLFARGVNMVIPHGMWYNPKKVYISPLVSPYSEKLADALPAYSNYVGRSSMLLRGGRRVSEIGVMYPFEGLAGWFCFDNPDNIRQGFYVSPETDYQTISGWLTNDIRRDFTFVHPEFFIEDKYSVANGKVKLNNSDNFQEYSVMMLTGSNVISLKTLQKLKTFYDDGGAIVATTQLPYKAIELGKDAEVIALVRAIFGVDPTKQEKYAEQSNSNSQGGRSIFIRRADMEKIGRILKEYQPYPDVIFADNPELKTDLGKLNYIHKIKEGKHIYLFTNSSDETISTTVLLRGKLQSEKWNPHNGQIIEETRREEVIINTKVYTKVEIKLPPVKSIFVVGNNE